MKKGEYSIEKMTDYLKFTLLLKDKTIEEKKVFLCKMKKGDLVPFFLTDCHDIIECYDKIYEKDSEKYYEKLYDILMKRADDYIKADYVACLNDENKKKEIILSVSNLYVRGIALQHLYLTNQKAVIDTILDEEILKSIYMHTYNLLVLLKINDDDFKSYHLGNRNISEQVQIICSFNSDSLKYFYSKNPIYQEYLSDITLSINDLKYKKEIFYEHNQITDFEFKLEVINKIEDIEEFNILLELLPDSFIKDIFNLSRKQNKDNIIKYLEFDKQNITTNSDLKFKISIDLNITMAPDLKKFNRLFDNWIVEVNPYYNNQVRITSPVLPCSKEGFKEVKVISDLLKKNCCYPVNNSLMSIKFNFDYFKSLEEFYYFMKLYLYSEDILNYMSNRIGVNYISNSTLSFSYLLDYLKSIKTCFNQTGKLEDFINEINSFIDSDNYKLNLLGCSCNERMIEFKIANGEIDYQELSKTIILFTKLMEISKLLTNISKKNIAISQQDKKETLSINRELLINCLKERKNLLAIIDLLNKLSLEQIVANYSELTTNETDLDRSELLLKLLFKDNNEQRVYRERYLVNSDITGYHR